MTARPEGVERLQADEREAAARTLKYWCDVEALTAPQAEKSEERGDGWSATYIRPGDTLPWDPTLRPARPHWHFVRFGIVSRKSYDSELLHLLNAARADDPETTRRSKDPKPYTYLGLFAVDHEGIPLIGSLQMAAFAPAFASLQSDRQIDFPSYQEQLAEQFDQAASILRGERRIDEADGESRPVPAGPEVIAAATARALALLGWNPAGIDRTPLAIVVSKLAVTETGRPKEPQIDPVNGFFLPDLLAITRDITADRASGLVRTYLADPDESARRDCTTPEAIDAALTVSGFPLGRWPARFGLTLMQQVAVNEALQRLEAGGIFSVNGPPGTGKTTLLMDVVAALLVARAEILATIADPQAAFTHASAAQYPGQSNPAYLYEVDRRLLDFSIVVASSNNGAVENITKEFPNRSKVAAPLAWQDPFRATADALLGLRAEEDDEDEPDDEPAGAIEAWALVSAALGKKSNRLAFGNTLDAKRFDKESGRQLPEPWNVFRLIEEHDGVPDWPAARRAFDAAKARVAELHAAIGQLDQASRRVAAAAAGLGALDAAAADRMVDVQAATAALGAAEALAAEFDADLRAAERETARRAPGRLDRLLASLPGTIGLDARRKLAAHRAALDRCSACVAARQDAVLALRSRRDALSAAQAGQVSTLEAARAARAEAEAAGAALGRLVGELGDRVAWQDFLAASEDARQQMLPRSSAALEAARADLFLKAMQLHRAFVIGAGDPFRRNLRRALGMLGGDQHLRPQLPSIGKHLWATLFLLVPVVSTTFASFARCFEAMPPGGIGWLIVDEAGQAVPHHAVGALARAKRALIVGDPLQLEPVITLDTGVDAKLRERHGARLEHCSTATSLQVLADRNNPFGTYLRAHDGERIWVGSPLRVHRRCVEPMFSIANRLAYNDKMVLGRGKAEEERRLTDGPRPLLGDSAWFDIPGGSGSTDHYVPEQGDKAMELVRRFMAEGWLSTRRDDGLPDLYILSPFKSVAQAIQKRLRKDRRDWAGEIRDRDFAAWMKRSVGTIHTFQGKEAEAVILLLGGRSEGAIKWAASTPNLLNVAVTRAQRRLYVIGDWDAWMRWPLVKGSMSDPGWRARS